MMKAAIFSLLLLLLLLLALRSSCEQPRLINPFDMTGEDDERPVVPEKRPPLRSQPPPAASNPLQPPPEALNPLPPASAPVCPALPKGINYGTFYRQLVRQLWTKVAGAHNRLKSDRLQALVQIPARAKHILDDFVDGKETTVQEVNNAFDLIFHSFSREGPASGHTSWLEPAQLRETVTYCMLVFVLFLVLVPMVFIGRSNFSGFKRFFLAVFYLGWVWSWIVLYKKKLAARRAKLHGKANACDREPWIVEFGHYLASYVVIAPDHCAELHESLEVDPWLEVNPVNALVHMLTQLLLEPSRPIAESLVGFIRTVSTGLPVLYTVGALLAVGFFLLVLLTYAFGYRIRIPLLLSVEPAERRAPAVLPPEVEAHLKELIGSTMERHHKAWMERPRLMRRNSMLAERTLTHRLPPKAGGDGPLEEDSAEEAGEEEAARRPPPENLT